MFCNTDVAIKTVGEKYWLYNGWCCYTLAKGKS